jgi:alpha-D-ribose 1-methylphosphonate 5-triphosphate synthase subunit PhnI
MAASKGEQAMSESEKTIQEQCYGTCWGAQQRIDELTQQLNAANDRIKRLEEAGDALCAAAAFMGWHMEIEKWNKSKEAKP